MAYTVAELKTAILQRLDYENAGLFSATALLQLINASAVDLHLILQGLSPELGYGTNSVTLAISPGVTTYSLPTSFQSPIRVQWVSNDVAVPLDRFEFADLVTFSTGQSWALAMPPRYAIGWTMWGPSVGVAAITFAPTPQTATTITVFYREAPPQFSADTDPVTLYPEWIIRDCIVKALLRLRKDASQEAAERDKLTALITNSLILSDEANPPRVADVRRELHASWWWR